MIEFEVKKKINIAGLTQEILAVFGLERKMVKIFGSKKDRTVKVVQVLREVDQAKLQGVLDKYGVAKDSAMTVDTRIITSIARHGAGVLAKVFTDKNGRKFMRIAGKRDAVLEFIGSQQVAGDPEPVPPSVACTYTFEEAKTMSKTEKMKLAELLRLAGEAADKEFEDRDCKISDLEKSMAAKAAQSEARIAQREKEYNSKVAQSEQRMATQEKDREARSVQKEQERERKFNDKITNIDRQVANKTAEQDKKIVESSQKMHTELRDISATQGAQAESIADLFDKIETIYRVVRRIAAVLDEEFNK